MRKITTLFCLLILTAKAMAQGSEADSLLKVISVTKVDSVRINTLLALSKMYVGTEPVKALTYANQAKKLADSAGYLIGLAYAYKNIGLVYYIKSEYFPARENFEKALALFDSIKDKKGSANMLSNIGAIYMDQGRDNKALEYFLRSLDLSEQLKDKHRIATALSNVGSVYSHNKSAVDKGIEYYRRSLQLAIEMKDNYLIGTASGNIGELYFTEKGQDDTAMLYLNQSLNAYKGTESEPYPLMWIGRIYAKRKNFITALKYENEAYKIAKQLDGKLDMVRSLIALGETNYNIGNTSAALNYYAEAEKLGHEIDTKEELVKAYNGYSDAYAEIADFKNAYHYKTLFANLKDTLLNTEAKKKLAGLYLDFDEQQKQGQINLLNKEKALKEVDLQRQRAIKYGLLGGLGLTFLLALNLYRNYRNKIKVNKILDSQKAEIESLVLNILPQEVAHELQKTGVATPKYYELASVLFTDFKSFSRLADAMSPQDVVTELNECFVAFDEIIEKYNLEKIKTIGDAYMCAGGIPTVDKDHFIRLVQASLEMLIFINQRNERRQADKMEPWDIRIGIHSGPLVAGVVGKKKYAYDIWGGTVNIASRMESNGEPGRVNISSATYELVKHKYACSYRGKISAKNIGEIDMYFVDAALN